jgi:DNA-binding transcriptional MerR regulator
MGATAADMAIVRETVLGLAPNQNISSLPPERIDYTAARDTIEMLRRIERLQEIGISENVIRRMWENFEPRTDREMRRGYYSESRQTVPAEVIESLGFSVQDVDRMSREELLEFLRRAAGE